MVNKNDVMIGDIIRLKKWAFEVVEIQSNAILGRLLPYGVGTFIEAWPRVDGYYIDEDLLRTLGYEPVDERSIIWACSEFKGEHKGGYKLTYSLADRTFTLLNEPTKERGFCYAYADYLHELMHLYKLFRIDCSGLYKRMRDYKLPTDIG